VTGRTLVITNDFPPRAGGIQSFVYGLVIRQPAGSVVVYCPKWRGSVEFDAAQPFPVVRHRNTLMLPDPGVLHTARRVIEQYGCDSVLYGATAPLGLLAAALGRSGITHQVGITHGHEAAWSDIPGVSRLIHRIGQHTDTITYLGQYTRDRLAAALGPRAARRMRQLVPGVDDATFHPRNHAEGLRVRERHGFADRPVIVCVSRLMPRKGQDLLIRALPSIAASVPGAALMIVGGGPYRDKLEKLVLSEGLQRDVVITGAVPYAELPAHYAAGDVFAMPCRTRRQGLDFEGLGIVYLEASATGLPVVAGNSGGAPDAVLDGVTGVVVDGDSLASTASAIAGLLGDPDRCRQMGAAGRAWIDADWQWPGNAARLTELLAGRDPDLLS